MEEEVLTKKTGPAGAFIESLKRNNKQIRDDRAEAIYEDTQLVFGRQIEDLEMEIKRLNRDRENMLDLSPSHGQSLQLATDFKADEFVKKDVELGVKIRNTEITLEIAKKRYNHLFGGNK